MYAWEDPEVDWSESSLCIIRTPHDYFMHLPQFLQWTKKVEEYTTLWNSSSVIKWNSTKKYLIKLLEAGVPVPPTIYIQHKSKEQLNELLEDTDWDEIINKTSHFCWGMGHKKI
jgi:glutathione synthase/RimK-type ligase-like ATP-grasp enzyme